MSEERKTLPTDEAKRRIIDQASLVDMKMFQAKSPMARRLVKFKRNFLEYYFTNAPMWKIVKRAASREPRMLPGFASIGPVRSGTSLLADYLMQHPCVALPLTKEIIIARSPNKRMFLGQFPTVREGKALEARYGTATTGYCTPIMPNFSFPYLMSEVAPDLKFVIILRNPIDRLYSHWAWDQMMMARQLRDPLYAGYPDFDEMVRIEIASAAKGGAGLRPMAGANGGSYLGHSIYLPFLELLFEKYDREKSFILNAQDFFSDPQGTAKKIYSFLALPDYDPAETPVKNATKKEPMKPETRQALQDFFAPLNQQLYEFVGEDYGWE